MKKKITLFLTLILALVAILSFGAITASADTANEEGWKVSANDTPVEKGSDVTIKYTLTYNGNEVDTLLAIASDGNFYGVKPVVKIFEGETLVADGATINTKDMEKGDKNLVLVVYDPLGKELAGTTFKLSVNKKDHTSTIIMIVLIVGIVGYMIWSNISNKKKQKKAQEKAGTLKIGDRVKTIGGVCGFVTEINDAENTFVLEVGENSFVKFDKGAIYQSAPAGGNAKEETETKEENK